MYCDLILTTKIEVHQSTFHSYKAYTQKIASPCEVIYFKHGIFTLTIALFGLVASKDVAGLKLLGPFIALSPSMLLRSHH